MTIFHDLHVKGKPLILYNVWDAGTAQIIQQAGGKAVATGSNSVSRANGYTDGEHIPFELAVENVKRIVGAVTLPVTFDIESGYAADVTELRHHVKQVIETGVAGINVEDQIVGDSDNRLYSVDEQSARIRVIREEADQASNPLFINARTDVFFKRDCSEHTPDLLEEVLDRTKAYAAAGASGIFVPGLANLDLIRELCDRSSLPVNIMILETSEFIRRLASAGVSRISYGPGPYLTLMAQFEKSTSDAIAYLGND
ncbi:isocitrate lyase/phosphoenolpyruvate mutase family protein [Paenibacillaceae bacterium]|nr:isocitrate lyase/phosphoenolpyruvate mutase family protein [Paenibacillaceae bacterium]